MSQNQIVYFHSTSGGSMKSNVSVIGIDLAKDVFQMHGTDKNGKKVFGKRVTRKNRSSIASID